MNGDANTIIYSVVPWTAGGLGDGQLAPEDQTVPYYCQDGGFNPKGGGNRAHPAVEQQPNQPKCPSLDGFCDYGLGDLIINQVAVELQNTITDPLLNAWQDASQREVTDECRNFFAPVAGGEYVPLVGGPGAGNLFNQVLGTNHYYINNSFNQAAQRLNYPGIPCLHGVRLEPKFTMPNPVNAGDIVGFNGMESNITLNSAVSFNGGGSPQANYATYTWNFGDGSPVVTGYAPGAPICEAPWLAPCAASTFHAYTYGGTYPVTLTVTDVGGNTSTVTQNVKVIGPPPPSPESPVSPGGSGGTSGSAAGGQSGAGAAGGSGGSSKGSAPPVPAPLAASVVLTHSLRSAVRRGLVVRYSVNEQVTGRFEVLLSRAVANRLHISGPTAVGLPPGSAPAVVIGRALLITTAGGRNTLRVTLAHAAGARLGKARRVSLTLRLIVRNAAAGGPASATVMSNFTLSR